MNAFAHSADSESVTIDLRDLLGLLVELSSRYASMRGVRLEIDRPSDAVPITTSPFVLLNLLWFCLDYSMVAAGPGKTVELAAEKTADGARLRFRKLEGMDAAAGSFPADPEGSLGRALRAELRIDPESRELAVSLPGKGQGE
jgi:hypothetical protein